ncbi:MAG TPA: hypothetical protein VHI13_16715 [Candidatus Kapabacteria bacterium]|nr:hypothetical protein [Candidatus Kapabacteria bacterium]
MSNIEEYPPTGFGKRDTYARGEIRTMIRSSGEQCRSMSDRLSMKLDGTDPETRSLLERAIRLLNEAHNKLSRIAKGEQPAAPTPGAAP